MPKSLSHAVVLTTDVEEVVRFCTDIAGITEVSRYEIAADDLATLFGWQDLDAPVTAAFVGEGAGSLDLVEIPERLRGDVQPGLRLLAAVNRDAAAAGERAADAGFPVRGPFSTTAATGQPMSLVEVVAGGVPFELIQFG